MGKPYSQDLRDRVVDALEGGLSTREVAARFSAQHMTPVATTPEEFQATIEREVKQWRDVAQAANLKAE